MRAFAGEEQEEARGPFSREESPPRTGNLVLGISLQTLQPRAAPKILKKKVASQDPRDQQPSFITPSRLAQPAPPWTGQAGGSGEAWPTNSPSQRSGPAAGARAGDGPGSPGPRAGAVGLWPVAGCPLPQQDVLEASRSERAPLTARKVCRGRCSWAAAVLSPSHSTWLTGTGSGSWVAGPLRTCMRSQQAERARPRWLLCPSSALASHSGARGGAAPQGPLRLS